MLSFIRVAMSWVVLLVLTEFHFWDESPYSDSYADSLCYVCMCIIYTKRISVYIYV